MCCYTLPLLLILKTKNMNAREKASELIVNYQLQCKSLDYEQAKQCALIAVEEILHCEATEPSDTDWDDCGATAQYYWPQKKVDAGKFWGDVKSELQSF
jgi:hypothetical protein